MEKEVGGGTEARLGEKDQHLALIGNELTFTSGKEEGLGVKNDQETGLGVFDDQEERLGGVFGEEMDVVDDGGQVLGLGSETISIPHEEELDVLGDHEEGLDVFGEDFDLLNEESGMMGDEEDELGRIDDREVVLSTIGDTEEGLSEKDDLGVRSVGEVGGSSRRDALDRVNPHAHALRTNELPHAHALLQVGDQRGGNCSYISIVISYYGC